MISQLHGIMQYVGHISKLAGCNRPGEQSGACPCKGHIKHVQIINVMTYLFLKIFLKENRFAHSFFKFNGYQFQLVKRCQLGLTP